MTERVGDIERAHEARIRRLEDRQREALRWLETLKEQVRLLRERAGLPADLEHP